MEAIDELAERIGARATELGLTVGVAESLTGGLVVEALARAGGSSEWLRGGVVAYQRRVKHHLLGVETGRVVSEGAAVQMAAGARKVLEADVTVAVTGVGGPDEQDGQPPGTVWIATDDGATPRAAYHRFGGEPAEICAQTTFAALAALHERFADRCDPVERIGG